MSIDSLPTLNLSDPNLLQSSSHHPLLLRLRQALISCSSSIESGDFQRSDKSIGELVDFLNSVTDAVVSEPDEDSPEHDAFRAVIDALSFELPKAVARFACVSRRCLEIAERVIDRFIEICSPRDMISILCEALDSPSTMFKVPGYFVPLLSGLSKVFMSIQRRQFEQVKAAVPVIVNVLKAVSSELDDGDTDYEDLLTRSIDIAKSVQAVCLKLEDEGKEKLQALLGLYVLEIMAFVSIGLGYKVSSCLSLMSQLTYFLRFCNLSYLGLITGCDVDIIIAPVVGVTVKAGQRLPSQTMTEDGDDLVGCFAHVKHGACLAVIWGFISNEVAQAADEDLAAVKAKLSSDQTKRWQAIGMLRNIFSCVNLPWELKKQAINFLLSIVDGNVSRQYDNEHMECLSDMPSIFATLQAIQMVIIYAPEAEIRRNAFHALKKVLADIPTSMRFDTLTALIKNSDSSSMMAILIDCVREEMRMENCQRISRGNQVIQAQKNSCHSTAFWNDGPLELVGLVLRPPKGGPPSLPEYGDAVILSL
ncbi:hypothetical protein RHGRI_005596 [Rhododendron griersonianum]|uniref:Aberrant root formation protein 4 n=1 Tax=Rhododendron griersonianum TaxID=479676 RepID=A0AAV6LE34_9ERIC|nr:hypothetical protein RHGRI_005596 [Rhododendron griersonianum]